MTSRDLQKLMWKKVGIIRRRQKLKEALKQIKQWEQEPIKDVELKNMLLVSRLIVTAALKRKRSLGCHMIE